MDRADVWGRADRRNPRQRDRHKQRPGCTQRTGMILTDAGDLRGGGGSRGRAPSVAVRAPTSPWAPG